MIKINFSAIKLAILMSGGLSVASLGQSTLAQDLLQGQANQAPALELPTTLAPAAPIYSEVQPVAEPGWYPYVIARGADRAIIESTPIELRPYRPFHFYGNTVRRNYYRGNTSPFRQ